MVRVSLGKHLNTEMTFDELVKCLLEEFNPPYDQRRYSNNRTYNSKGNDISNTPKPVSITSAYDNKLAPASPSTLPGNLFPDKKELKRRAKIRERRARRRKR